MKEYIVHGTPEINLLMILKDGYINNIHVKKSLKILEDMDPKQIFTQLLYKNIPNQEYQICHWNKCAIILDKKILQDYPFYACKVGHFYENFNNAFENNSERVFVKGCGNLKKIPNLKKLKTVIKKRMVNEILGSVSFIHSHEILFNQKIYLKDYCLCIIYNDRNEEIPDKIKLMCKK